VKGKGGKDCTGTVRLGCLHGIHFIHLYIRIFGICLV
jgi:hypothetical protein